MFHFFPSSNSFPFQSAFFLKVMVLFPCWEVQSYTREWNRLAFPFELLGAIRSDFPNSQLVASQKSCGGSLEVHKQNIQQFQGQLGSGAPHNGFSFSGVKPGDKRCGYGKTEKTVEDSRQHAKSLHVSLRPCWIQNAKPQECRGTEVSSSVLQGCVAAGCHSRNHQRRRSEAGVSLSKVKFVAWRFAHEPKSRFAKRDGHSQHFSLSLTR